jgi:hypothetical protein
MRDVAIRRGVVRVVEDFRTATGLDERIRTGVRFWWGPRWWQRRRGRLIVPAITLWALVPGIRARSPTTGRRLVEYLVANFDELVYV